MFAGEVEDTRFRRADVVSQLPVLDRDFEAVEGLGWQDKRLCVNGTGAPSDE